MSELKPGDSGSGYDLVPDAGSRQMEEIGTPGKRLNAQYCWSRSRARYIVPFLIAGYNNEVAIRQRAEDLARSKNDLILQAQSKLLEDLSTVLVQDQPR